MPFGTLWNRCYPDFRGAGRLRRQSQMTHQKRFREGMTMEIDPHARACLAGTLVLAALLASSARLHGAGRSRGELSQQADPRDRAVRRRRRQRHLRARWSARKLGEILGQTVRDREPAERRRAARGGVRHHPAGRRLHAVRRRQRRDVDRGRGLSEARLSSDQELHPALDDRELSADHGESDRPSGENGRRSSSPMPRPIPTSRTTPPRRRRSPSRPELLKLKTGMPGVAIPLQEQQRDDPVRRRRELPVLDRRRAADGSAW